MIATIWRFGVKSGSVEPFEQAYGPRGDWARLFALAEGYAGTELLKFDGQPGQYMTIDRWGSREHFERARTLLATDYAALDRRCEAYTSEETWLGLHTVIE